jgi:hypothetical protein
MFEAGAARCPVPDGGRVAARVRCGCAPESCVICPRQYRRAGHRRPVSPAWGRDSGRAGRDAAGETGGNRVSTAPPAAVGPARSRGWGTASRHDACFLHPCSRWPGPVLPPARPSRRRRRAVSRRVRARVPRCPRHPATAHPPGRCRPAGGEIGTYFVACGRRRRAWPPPQPAPGRLQSDRPAGVPFSVLCVLSPVLRPVLS